MNRFIAFGMIQVCVALALLEIILRLADPFGIRYYFDVKTYFESVVVPDPGFAYIHKANYSGHLQGVDVQINSEGLRSPEVPARKPSGEKRLLILGDSVVFGWAVSEDEIFPALLRRRLKSALPQWSVISAGVGSWNTRTEYEWLQRRGVDLDPDVLLLVVVDNDVEPKSSGRTFVDPEKLREELTQDEGRSIYSRAMRKFLILTTRTSYAGATFRYLLRRRGVTPRLATLYRHDSLSWKDARDALDRLVELCNERRITLIVYLWGDQTSDLSRIFFERYGGRLHALGIPYQKFPAKLFTRQFRNSTIDAHSNPAGHQIIADTLYETILPILTARQ